MDRPSRRRAFALVELLVVVLVLALVGVIASLLVPDSRRRARLAGSIENLQQLGKGSLASAADNENRVPSFTWTPGPHSCDGFAFGNAADHNQAAADQAICIIRRLSGRTDITRVTGWIPHVLYNHLALMEYLDEKLPSPMVVSPGDSPRLAWQRAALVAARDPGDQGQAYLRLTCRPGGSGNTEKRWPYSSSYEVQPSFYSPDAQRVVPPGVTIPTVAQSPMGHRWYTTGNSQTLLGQRRFDEVWHPSHKAYMYETNQRFFGSRELWFLFPEARVPVLCADGSASVRSAAQANPGFFPNTPLSVNPTRVNYSPELSWETPTANGSTSEFVNGSIRWTRSGLRGRDFQGPEVPWVP